MPLSADELKALIPIEIGDTGIVAAKLDTLWTKHDNRTLWLQYLWAKRDAIQMLMGSVWQDFSVATADGDKLNFKEKYDNLAALFKTVTDEIASYRGNRAPRIGQMTAQAPTESPPNQPDANSSVYRGDPNVLPPLVWPR